MGYFKIMSLKQKVMSGLYWTSLGKIIGQMIIRPNTFIDPSGR